mmetsp:Transcript_56081/g.167845  ORF Transcript_56081/g.167845 Transcript_56081/m.167845 type:complete len:83 (+) Transcript_56081:894-1142(+)
MLNTSEVVRIKCGVPAKRNFIETLPTSHVPSTRVNKIRTRSVSFDWPPIKNYTNASKDSLFRNYVPKEEVVIKPQKGQRNEK